MKINIIYLTLLIVMSLVGVTLVFYGNPKNLKLGQISPPADVSISTPAGNYKKTSNKYCIAAHLDYSDFTEENKLDQIGLLQKSGASWVRFDFEALRFIKNQIADFSYFDQIIDRLKERNLGVIALLPQWAEKSGETYKETIKTPERYGEYAKFLAEYLKRKNINFIVEVGNEPNDPGFWPDRDPFIYTKYLVSAYDSVKAVDENIPVMTGGVVMYINPFDIKNNRFNALNWVKELYAAGVKSEDKRHSGIKIVHFDIYAVHIYTGNNSPNRYIKVLKDIKSYIKRQGDSGDIAITEIGWPTGGDSDPENVSYTKQAELIKTTLGEIAKNADLNPKVVCYYSLVNKGESEKMQENYGLLEFDLTPKPAYEAFKEITR